MNMHVYAPVRGPPVLLIDVVPFLDQKFADQALFRIDVTFEMIDVVDCRWLNAVSVISLSL